MSASVHGVDSGRPDLRLLPDRGEVLAKCEQRWQSVNGVSSTGFPAAGRGTADKVLMKKMRRYGMRSVHRTGWKPMPPGTSIADLVQQISLVVG